MFDLDRMIDNPSDQTEAYSEEVAKIVNNISERFKFTKEFALQIVQTAIEDSKLDAEHHKAMALNKIANAIDANAIVTDDISCNMRYGFEWISNAIEAKNK